MKYYIMKNIYKICFILSLVIALCFSCEATALGQIVGSTSVQTNPATNIFNYQATLNGYLAIPYISGNASNYVYFEWGTDLNYNNKSGRQYLSSGSFSQVISGLYSNTTYHFRAVAQNNYGTIYGQDMIFYNSGGGYYPGYGSLSVNKKVINLTSGNLIWSSSVTARPGDILSFAITLQPGTQDTHNVVTRDILPANLVYRGNVTINTNSNYSGNIISGINIGTVYANQPVVVAYQAQVAQATSINYGTTTLINSVTITSQETGTQTASVTVLVNNSLVYGAATVSTGLTNNFLTDSFLLPLLIIILGLWLYFSGNAIKFADWLNLKIKK